MGVVTSVWSSTRCHLRLRSPHLVVREDQITATTLQINRDAEMVQRNG